jgi:hypothetical protein
MTRATKVCHSISSSGLELAFALDFGFDYPPCARSRVMVIGKSQLGQDVLSA